MSSEQARILVTTSTKKWLSERARVSFGCVIFLHLLHFITIIYTCAIFNNSRRSIFSEKERIHIDTRCRILLHSLSASEQLQPTAHLRRRATLSTRFVDIFILTHIIHGLRPGSTHSTFSSSESVISRLDDTSALVKQEIEQHHQRQAAVDEEEERHPYDMSTASRVF